MQKSQSFEPPDRQTLSQTPRSIYLGYLQSGHNALFNQKPLTPAARSALTFGPDAQKLVDASQARAETSASSFGLKFLCTTRAIPP